ncbi:MAG: lipopolysaccharide biosynthesis protein [Bacillota bacterium]
MSFVQNSIWSFINVFGAQILGLIANIILARLLYPEIFGVLGMAMAFAGLMLVFQEAGLSSYIIYKKYINDSIISNSFYINIVISLLLCFLLLMISSDIGYFYGIEEVGIVIIYIAIGMAFGSFGITSRALLTKARNFKALAKIDLISELIASILAIIFAIYSLELLAITSRLVIKPLIQSLILIWIQKIKLLPLNFGVIKEILPFSSKFLGSQLLIYINNNIDYFLIGKLLGSRNLGIYTVSYQWSVMPRFYISGAINKVAFPEISENNQDIHKVKEIYINIIQWLSFLTFPACTGLIVIASDFILVLYGNKWIDSAMVLQILLISGMITSVGTIGGSVINGLGKPIIEMYFNFVSILVLITCLIIGSNYGLIGIAIAILIRSMILEFVKQFIINKLINISFNKFIKEAILVNLFSALIMMIVLFIFKSYLEDINIYMKLLILVISGFFIYFLISLGVNKTFRKYILSKINSKIN